MNLYPEWIHLFLCTMYHDPSDLGSLILIGIIIKKIVSVYQNSDALDCCLLVKY